SLEFKCEPRQTVYELGDATEHDLLFEGRRRAFSQGVQEVAIGLGNDFAEIVVRQTLVKVSNKGWIILLVAVGHLLRNGHGRLGLRGIHAKLVGIQHPVCTSAKGATGRSWMRLH